MRIGTFSMIVLFGGLSFVAATTARAASDDAAMLAASCAGCHGTDGRSPGEIPSIIGPSITDKTAAFVERILKEYRDGARKGTMMNWIARGYSDDQIKAMADYFGRRK